MSRIVSSSHKVGQSLSCTPSKSSTPFWSICGKMTDWILSRVNGITMDHPRVRCLVDMPVVRSSVLFPRSFGDQDRGDSPSHERADLGVAGLDRSGEDERLFPARRPERPERASHRDDQERDPQEAASLHDDFFRTADREGRIAPRRQTSTTVST